MSGSMQRTIDRLIKSTLEDSKNLNNSSRGGSIVDSNGRIKFDRRLYDLDLFNSILSKVEGYPDINKMS